LPEGTFEKIQTHAKRGIEFVDDYETTLEITSRHDELAVVARFDSVRMIGEIDHLAIIDNVHHIIDYKTNDTSKRAVDALAMHYRPQLEVYAAALHQADPTKTIRGTLYFTDAAEARQFEWSSADLDNLVNDIKSTITD